MQKSNYVWSVWRISVNEMFVLVQRRKDGKSAVFSTYDKENVTFHNPMDPFPDVRLYYPTVQEAIPPICRAKIRAMMLDTTRVSWQ